MNLCCNVDKFETDLLLNFRTTILTVWLDVKLYIFNARLYS